VSDKEPSTPKAAAKKKSTKRDSLSIPNEDEGEYEWNRIQARLLADDDEVCEFPRIIGSRTKMNIVCY